jgi:DNA polymerase
MRIVVVDLETYYDKEYSLSKMTTEAYIRDPRFEVIGVGVYEEVAGRARQSWMEADDFREWAAQQDWHKVAILCHHTHFDGAILAWRFNINPALWLDTLSMSRAVVGGFSAGGSLAKLAKLFDIGEKGTEVLNALGKRRKDFTPEEWYRYGEYCLNDCELTLGIFRLLSQGFYAPLERQITTFPNFELKLIDRTIRMFTEPEILLDPILLRSELAELRTKREKLLAAGGVDRDVLMSNPKFAEALQSLGVSPPTKISPTTGKVTWAFAKTDKGMTELLEHEDEDVQTLVAARLGNKSTIAETRVERLIGIASRGPLPVYLNYCGADQSHRFSGGDKLNLQNMPKKGAIRSSLCAPPGHMFVVVDSANIEARVVDCLAGETEAVEVYRKADRKEGPDIYCYMASKRYGRPITKADVQERQFGKVLKLACGFGMGGAKFKETARQWGLPPMTEDEAQSAVVDYRSAHKQVVKLWKAAQDLLPAIRKGNDKPLDPAGLVVSCNSGLVLPHGLVIKYPNLRQQGDEWVYDAGKFTGTRIYGGKVVENVVQSIARAIVMEQSLEVCRRHPNVRLVLSVHDEAVYVVPEADAEVVAKTAYEVFCLSPTWWPDVPLSAEAHTGFRYSEAK